MTFSFNPLPAIVLLTHKHAKDQGKRSVAIETGNRRDRQTDYGGDCITSRASAVGNYSHKHSFSSTNANFAEQFSRKPTEDPSTVAPQTAEEAKMATPLETDSSLVVLAGARCGVLLLVIPRYVYYINGRQVRQQ